MTEGLTKEPRLPRVKDASSLQPSEEALAFALNFISGKGLLSSREKKVGGIEIKVLELEIPDISFPFDVTGGADRFKTKRCVLRHLAFGLDADQLNDVLAKAALTENGFVELKVALRDGFIELAGRFKVGEEQADFTMRAAPLLRSPQELGIVFYDTRTYGHLPVPASLLPVYLYRALNLKFIDASRAGMWILRPAEQFLRNVLPRQGWKIPDTRRAQLVAAEVARGRITVVAGPEGDPSPKQLAEREPPAIAVLAAEGVTAFTAAEEKLAKGSISEAYDKLREAMDDERGGRWAKERLLQIGAADPELALETRQLAEEVLAQDGKDIQALCTLAAIALRERSWGEAANRYGILAQIAQEQKSRYDVVGSELAAAAAAAPVDPQGALQAYERAAARARDSVAAHQALLELRQAVGDWEGAARAGDRVVKLLTDPAEQARVHRELGQLHRVHLRDLKAARSHFERALRLAPDDPGALEGLAETYAARGEPARAASYLARLAEQAEESGDKDRIVALNLRLGEIWERWVNDREAAATRYYRVLDVDPRNRPARLRLAELFEAKGELTRARALYEDILSAEDTTSDPAATSDLVAAYVRLARVTMSSSGATSEAIACLERAVELDPSSRVARDELVKILRGRGEWARLILALEETARLTPNPEERRRALLDAARLELAERKNYKAAQKHLELLLDSSPEDSEALELLLPLLTAERATEATSKRLLAAAAATREPVRRATLYYQNAHAQKDPALAEPHLIAALDANPFLAEAALALVANTKTRGTTEQRAIALARLGIAAKTPEARAEAFIERAELLTHELGRPGDAEAALREALEHDAGNVTALSRLAALREERGELEGARAAIESALGKMDAQDRRRAELHARLASLAHARGDVEVEARELERALALGGASDVKLRSGLSEALEKLGKAKELAELQEQWAQQSEGEERDKLLLEAGARREKLGENDRALALYKRVAAEQGPPARKAAQSLERLAMQMGDWSTVSQAIGYQLEAAPPADHQRLLERLLSAQISQDDALGAEATCLRLLDLDPKSLLAHAHLAEHYLHSGAFGDALEHHVALLEQPPDKGTDRNDRRQLFERAAALAKEVAPDSFGKIRKGFDKEFPEIPPSVLEKPLAARYVLDGAWEQLLSLRRYQIDSFPKSADKLSWRRDAAMVLFEKLGKNEEAIPHLSEVVAQRPHDAEAREALLSSFERLGRFEDLAKLLFAMAELAGTPQEALAFGLRSTEVFSQKVDDETSAAQVLQVLCARQDIDSDSPELQAALRAHGLAEELSLLLERSIGAAADPEDGRLLELVELLSGQLNDAARAVAWCERLIETFPVSDVPRRLLVDTLTRHPQVGDPIQALQTWADARQGPERASVLSELSARLQSSGAATLAMQALVKAADADPRAEGVLTQLVERSTAQGDFPQVIRWLEQLALATDPGAPQDERWRRLLEVATDYANDPAAAIRALEGITKRTAEETKALAELYVDQGRPAEVVRLVDNADMLGTAVLLKAGAAVAKAGQLAEARRFLTLAMEAGEVKAAWRAAELAWSNAGKLLDLGKWRLEAARQSVGKEALKLKLLGYADVVDGGGPGEQVLPPGMLEVLARDVDANDNEQVWALFRATRSAKHQNLLDQTSRFLEGRLPEADPRLNEVLRARVHHELDEGNGDQAVELAERLSALGDDEGDRLLDMALTRAGRQDELLARLYARAEAAPDGGSPIWVRIAALRCDAEQWAEAAMALRRVPEKARGERWGELTYKVGGALEDPKQQAEGAFIAADRAQNDTAKALWLRKLARLLWWKLGDEARAVNALKRAHAISPVDLVEASSAAEGLRRDKKLDEAGRILDEACAVLSPADAAPLQIERAHLHIENGDKRAAREVLKAALPNLSDDAGAWAAAGRAAAEVKDGDLAAKAWARASELDPDSYDQEHVATLEAFERWIDAAQFLERRSDTQDPPQAAQSLERAAVLYERDGDKPRALGVLERAVKKHATLSGMSRAFALSVELKRPSLTAALGGALLKRMEAGARERPAVLRHFIDALDHLNLGRDAVGPREELLQRGLATPGDKAALAHIYAETDAGKAAPLLEQAAAEGDAADRGALYTEAATLWRDAGNTAQAAAALKAAIDAGADLPGTHLLAIELLQGDARLSSLGRIVELGADSSWPGDRRAVARLELARARLVLEDAEGALALLLEAETMGRAPGWVPAMEQTFLALGRDRELAELYVKSIRSGSPWKKSDEVTRLQRASDVFQAQGAVVEESEALELLKARSPDHPGLSERLAVLAAELGDRERYMEVARIQLSGAKDVAARDSVLVRAAAVLCDKFEEPAAARELLEPAFLEAPTLNVGKALEGVLEKLGDADAAVALYQAAAPKADTTVRPALVSRAAELSELAGEDEAAYALWREVLELVPSNERAQQGASSHVERQQRWDELVEICELAGAASTGPVAYGWFLRAADAVHAHAPNPEREVALLSAAVHAAPDESETVARLVDLRLERGELTAAKALILGGSLPPAREEDVVRRAVSDLEAAGQKADAEELMGWLEERYPESALAAEYKVARARSKGDRQSLRAALRGRLDTGELDTKTAAAIRREALVLAWQDGDRETALAEAERLLTSPEPDLDGIFEAWRVVQATGNAELAQGAVQLAVPHKDGFMKRVAAAKGEARVRWLELMGLVCEEASDEQGVEGAYTQALSFEDVPAPIAFAGLERAYTRRGEWARLLDLCVQRGERAGTPEERAEALYRAALVCRDQLSEGARAEELLSQALGQDSSHSGAQLAYGLLLSGRKQRLQALPYLETQVHAQSPETPVAHIQALAECQHAAGHHGKALALIDAGILRDPSQADLYPLRAEVLEASGRVDESEAAWMRYIEILGPSAEPDKLVPVFRRLAASARERGNTSASVSYLEQAHRLSPDDTAMLSELRSLYEVTGQWLEAAELRLREASLATDKVEQAQHFRALAAAFRDHLGDPRRAAVMLEKAAELGPPDHALLWELLSLHEAAANWSKYLVIGERLLAEASVVELTAEFYGNMAQAYQEGASDLVRAKEFYGKALEKKPGDAVLKGKYRELAEKTGDYATFVEAEEEALALYPPGDEKAQRLTNLADIYLKHLQQFDRAAAALTRALEINKNDPPLLRRLADVYALDQKSYAKAAELYRALLEQSPLDSDLLRILARLSGQVGDTDRAYGYYAALLVLIPSDNEAQRFVTACRAARPVGPQRPLTDADRAQGLVHPGQQNPYEDVYTPLARFAELTQPGDLARRGIAGDRDQLAPTDERKQYLQKVLEPLGLPQAKLFVWRAGGFACELELTNPVSILLGSVVANDAPERQRAFLVARAAELYRSGHALCEKLNPVELGALVAAQCMAVAPGVRPPTATMESDRWAGIIGAPMTPQIRGMLAPKVQSFLEKGADADVVLWRRASISTASRTAMLVSCDVEEAVSALLRLHGMDDLSDEQRVPVLQEADEELDLMRFATSELYFKLRQALGLALRRSR